MRVCRGGRVGAFVGMRVSVDTGGGDACVSGAWVWLCV